MIDKTLIEKVIADLDAIKKYLVAELVVANPPPPPPPPPNPELITVAVVGSAASEQQWNSSAVGFTKVPPTRHRPSAVTPPIPWRLTTNRAVPGVKTKLWSDSRFDFASLLYFPIPTTAIKNGKPKRAFIYHNFGADPLGGLTSVINKPLRGGAQGSAVISPYITIRCHKSGGTPDAPVGPLAFFWVADKVGYINAYGTSKLIAGRIPKDDMALFDEDNPDDYFHWVGNFNAIDGYPSHIVEGTLYDHSREYFFLTDYKQNCVWKIDRGDTPESRRTPSTWVWTKHATGLNKPVGIQDLPDGKLFLVDDDGLKQVDIVTGAVTLKMSLPKSMFLRATSTGKLVAGNLTYKFVEYDPVTGTNRVIHPGRGVVQTQWMFGDISPPAPHDYFVPADTIIFGSATGVTTDGNNNGIMSLSLDGVLTGDKVTKVFDSQGGSLPHGLITEVTDPYGHYPWLWSFHPELSIAFCAGFGSSGVSMLRPTHADDRSAYDYGSLHASGAGLIMRSGAPDGWPLGINPSLTGTWSVRWETYCGLTAHELVSMGKSAFADYMRSAAFDGVARPELGQLQIDGLWYWVNVCNLHGLTAGLPIPKVVPPANKTPPVISPIIIAVRLPDDVVQFSWTTNVPSIGFVAAGQSAGKYYRYRKEIAAGHYQFVHSAKLENCKPDRPMHFIVGAQSAEGYLATSANQILGAS